MIVAKPNFIDVLKEMSLTDAEYVLLRTISFFMPEQSVSEAGLKKVNKFKLKYIDTFNAVVYQSNPEMAPIDIMLRVSQLISLLAVVEVLSQVEFPVKNSCRKSKKCAKIWGA